jgi:SWI/SNF-related matrix-associated actin-dependent regulator 1 of chromatin subfamily A
MTVKTAVPLLEHQTEAVHYALKNRRVIIGDEMGVGKTPVAIGIIATELRREKSDGWRVRPFLVVVPPSMRLQWEREFARFCPDLTTRLLSGRSPVDDRRRSWDVPKADVLIMGDSSIAGYAKYLRGKIQGIVVDECQRLKNRKAQRSMGAVAVASQLDMNAIRVVMSGTPLINNPIELVPSLQVIGRLEDFRDGAQSGYDSFLNRYAPRIDRFGTRGTANLPELHKRLCENFMIRRRRQDVLELPAKGRITSVVTLTQRSIDEYQRAERDLFAFIEKMKGTPYAERAMRAEAIVRLNTLRSILGQGKIDAVVAYALHLLDQDEQVFITCAHTLVLNALVTRLGKHVRTVKVSGGMTDHEKMKAVDAFQDGDAKVLVGNIVASGVGLTLTSGRHHVSAELPWTSADLMQCEDRLARHGQKREVVSHVLLAQHIDQQPSLDWRMFALLDQKLGVVSQVLDGKTEMLVTEQSESVAFGVLRSYGWNVSRNAS